MVGRIGAPLTLDATRPAKRPIGQVVADAQLAATRRDDGGAQIALMNPGGLRAGSGPPADGQVRYEDLFAVQPFYNNLVTMTLTGAQLRAGARAAVAQPADGRASCRCRAASATRWDAPSARWPARGARQRERSNGQGADRRGEPLRVTVNRFLAGGGDNFTVLKQGQESRTGMMDIDAFELFVKANPSLMPGPLDRIMRVN